MDRAKIIAEIDAYLIALRNARTLLSAPETAGGARLRDRRPRAAQDSAGESETKSIQSTRRIPNARAQQSAGALIGGTERIATPAVVDPVLLSSRAQNPPIRRPRTGPREFSTGRKAGKQKPAIALAGPAKTAVSGSVGRAGAAGARTGCSSRGSTSSRTSPQTKRQSGIRGPVQKPHR